MTLICSNQTGYNDEIFSSRKKNEKLGAFQGTAYIYYEFIVVNFYYSFFL